MPFYVTLFAQALTVTVTAITPFLIILLIASVVIAMLQASLQLEDMALNLLPRLVLAALLVLGGGLGAFAALQQLMLSWLRDMAPLVHRSWF